MGQNCLPRAQTKLEKRGHIEVNNILQNPLNGSAAPQFPPGSRPPSSLTCKLHRMLTCPYQLFSPKWPERSFKNSIEYVTPLAQNPPLTSLSLRINLNLTSPSGLCSSVTHWRSLCQPPLLFSYTLNSLFSLFLTPSTTPYHYYYFTYNVMFLLLPLRDVSHPSWTRWVCNCGGSDASLSDLWG